MNDIRLVLVCALSIAVGCSGDDAAPSDRDGAIPIDGDASSSEWSACTPLVGRIVIEYLARASDGSLVVVLYADSDGALDYEDFRLFYGPEEQLRERTLTSVERQRDGGSTHLLFDLLGEEADAFFPVMLGDAGFEPGPATLELDGDTIALDRLEEDAELLADATFECFQ